MGGGGSGIPLTGDTIATTSTNGPTANAVFSLTNISALVIGADVNGDGTFRFDNDVGSASDFDLGATAATSDDPLDGLVIVRAGGGGAALPVRPLMLVEV